MNLAAMQAAISEAGCDGWLFYDHHHRDSIGGRILGLDEKAHVTRRWYYYVPAAGEPRKLAHRIESDRLDSLPGSRGLYSSWPELTFGLDAMLSDAHRIAMQYSPNNAIPSISVVDAGTVEFLRSLGKQIVTSADLVSQFEAVLSVEQVASHLAAQKIIDEILVECWQEIARRLRPPYTPARRSSDGITEFELAQWLRGAMRRAELIWESGPNVSVNANSSNSHYEPTYESSLPIREGDFLLIDLWACLEKPASVFYDVTWTAVIGRAPSEREQYVFHTVTQARDAAIHAIECAFAEGKPIRGFEADDVAREVIDNAGLGSYFTHRTGHNITTELHGAGANLDNLETHDERRILPQTCFSIEPGIYLPEFGIRSEINMLTEPQKAWVSGRIQTELLRI